MSYNRNILVGFMEELGIIFSEYEKRMG